MQARQLESDNSDTAQLIMGVMLESNLVEGNFFSFPMLFAA